MCNQDSVRILIVYACTAYIHVQCHTIYMPQNQHVYMMHIRDIVL